MLGIILNLSRPADANVTIGHASGDIIDDDSRISIANAPAVTEGNTGTRAASFIVTLSTASTETTTVAYATASYGSATAGSDYQATSGTLTFAPGETSKTITVLVQGDRLPEDNEIFYVNLSSPTNATITTGQGAGTIVDDEPRISIGDVYKKEGKITWPISPSIRARMKALANTQ